MSKMTTSAPMPIYMRAVYPRGAVRNPSCRAEASRPERQRRSSGSCGGVVAIMGASVLFVDTAAFAASGPPTAISLAQKLVKAGILHR